MFDFESSGISFDVHFVQILEPDTQRISIEKLLEASDFGRVRAGNAENHIPQYIHEPSIIIDTVEGGASRLRAQGLEPPAAENDVLMLAPGTYKIVHAWKSDDPNGHAWKSDDPNGRFYKEHRVDASSFLHDFYKEHRVDASSKELELSGTPYNNRKCSAIQAFGMIQMMNHSISMQLISFVYWS